MNTNAQAAWTAYKAAYNVRWDADVAAAKATGDAKGPAKAAAARARTIEVAAFDRFRQASA